MADLPLYIYILFGSTLLTTIIWFHYAVRSKPFLFVMIGWTIIQALIALSGIYQDTESMPPNMALYGVFPTLLAMIFVFLTKKGKAFKKVGGKGCVGGIADGPQHITLDF